MSVLPQIFRVESVRNMVQSKFLLWPKRANNDSSSLLSAVSETLLVPEQSL